MYYPPELFLNAELAYRREQIVAARRTRTSAPRRSWHPNLRITRRAFHRLAVGH
jgi:hypothetical protein